MVECGEAKQADDASSVSPVRKVSDLTHHGATTVQVRSSTMLSIQLL